MLSRKQLKQDAKSKTYNRDKITSPNVPNRVKVKIKDERRELTKKKKKDGFKTQSRIKEVSSMNSLFNSLRDLPSLKIPKQKNHKTNKKQQKISQSNNKNEDSTASRDFRQYLKHYDHPNGQYFGSRITAMNNEKKHSKKGSKSKVKQLHEPNAIRSLQRKIRQYRRLSSHHRSESESLKSQTSDQQMRRLQKIQSIQKMMLVEEIIELQSKRFNIKNQKQW